MHYLYILESEKNGRFYVGVTGNLEKRLKEHNSGRVKSTSAYRPWIIKRAEEFANSSLAYKRERFIKAKHSREIIKTIIVRS